MANRLCILLNALTYSFVISAFSLLIGFASDEDSFLQNLFDAIGFYSAVFTGCLFALHVVVFLLSRIIKDRNPKA